MYNHKLRGRPDDPKNRAISAAKKSLSKTIQVNALSPFNTPEPSQIEVVRSRHHYNEFKKSYQQKHSIKSIASNLPAKMPSISETPFNALNSMYKLEDKVVEKVVNIVEPKRILQKPKSSIRMPSISSWSANSESVCGMSNPEDTQAMLLLQKLREMEAMYSTPPQHTTTGTQSILEQVEKEASVSLDQLQSIQRLFQADKSTSRSRHSLLAIDEEDAEVYPKQEMHTKSQRKKVIDNIKKKQFDAKKKNMVMTLNNLNQRIQSMHDKYFNEPKFRYMSTKDIERVKSYEKNIETLYKNNDFDPEREISEILISTEDRDKLASSSSANQKLKSINIIRRCSSIPTQKSQIVSNVSSDNYLHNRSIVKKVKFEESDASCSTTEGVNDATFDVLKPSADSASSDEQPSCITSDNTLCSGVTLFSSSRSMSYPSSTDNSAAKIDVILSPRISQSSTNSQSLHNIQDSILRSEYLMKEFDISKSDLSRLSNYQSTKSSQSTTSSAHDTVTLPSLEEFFSATSHKSKMTMTKAFMEDSIRTQLKNSLYDII